MPHLSQGDQTAMLDALRELYAQTELDPLRELMLRLISRLVPNDWASYNEVAREGYCSILNFRIPDSVEVQRHAPAFLAHFNEHPNMGLDPVRASHAYTLSDFYTRRELAQTNIFNEYYRHVGVRHQLFFRFDHGHGSRRGIGINRGSGDFSARDRLVANLLSPHFGQAYVNVLRLERLGQIAAVVENPASTAAELALSLCADDRVDALSKSARQWISRHLGLALSEGSALPDGLLQWLRREDAIQQRPEHIGGPAAPLRLPGPRGEVLVRIVARKPGAFTVLFFKLVPAAKSVSTLALPELTRRENEVLAWIAQGKSNPEIAVILGLSVRTVYKHVENLFAKLGVESRGQAMVRALEPP